MADYKKMYLTLFNATEDAINTMENVRQSLIQAQRDCEEPVHIRVRAGRRVGERRIDRVICYVNTDQKGGYRFFAGILLLYRVWPYIRLQRLNCQSECVCCAAAAACRCA